jgi:hypothetical protein
LRQVLDSKDPGALDGALNSSYLDLRVPRDSRPFFFNQLRLFDVPSLISIMKTMLSGTLGHGVVHGNLIASGVLLLILCLSILAVITTIIVPLRSTAARCPRQLAIVGSIYFSLIGMGFMITEIALLQYFSVYLGHPIYSLGVCLFSLILASGLGSLASEKIKLNTAARLATWGVLIVGYIITLETVIPTVFAATTDHERPVRIAISLAAIMPMGVLLGFAFPSGMRLIEAIDPEPAPWFWGINGATGVLASVLGVMFSMAFGINTTMLIAAACYLLLIPTSIVLLTMAAGEGFGLFNPASRVGPAV